MNQAEFDKIVAEGNEIQELNQTAHVYSALNRAIANNSIYRGPSRFAFD